MAGRRPRLVHEGSPIGGSEYSAAGGNDDNFHHLSSRDASSSNPTSLGALHEEYKLKTSLVIGEQRASGDPDDMMMDDDDYDAHHHIQRILPVKNDEPTSLYYGSHGSVYHGHALENGNYTSGQTTGVDAIHQQHRQQRQEVHQYPTTSFNNHFESNNLSHLAPTPNPTLPPIYHMPSPLISPLVVLDGANIAYNYSESLHPTLAQHSSNLRRQPDPRGIRLVIEYFLKHHCRVQAVVPTSWYQLKPRPCDTYHLKNRTRGDSDAKMITEEVEELRNLRQQGFLVAIPPGDDDDAYALALARREEDRLLEQQQQQEEERSCGSHMQRQHSFEGMDEDDNVLPTKLPLGGYVVSNDMFQDAIRRDENRQHQQHLHSLSLSARPVSLKSWLMKKRISYSFANVGSSGDDDDFNTIRLDFIPNPRNELIEAIDACGRLHVYGNK